MKTITKEVKKNFYVAFDNTEFISEEQCAMYESSALMTFIDKLQGAIIYQDNQKDMFGFGNDNTKCYAMVLRTRNDIFNVNQILNLGYSKTDDLAHASDSFKLTILCVEVGFNNTVVNSYLIRPEKIIDNITNGSFQVVSMIKDEEKNKK